MTLHKYWILVVAIYLALAHAGCPSAPVGKNNATPAGQPHQAPQLTLTIDYGDSSAPKSLMIDWQAGLTVVDALRQAAAQDLTSVITGAGESAFVSEIGGIANQGAGEAGKNWIYYINDKQATRGAGVQTLQPGDRLEWRFEVYE
ncbi:MAG: DUF4430 domain-containing protein [Pirellulales bacterium]|nr:DUF4430 domain-containing protein [Pirellulales bacterium]